MQFAAVPLDSDILNTNKDALVGLGMALLALLGQGPFADGLACTPQSGLTIQIGPGSIYAYGVIDATSYGSLPSDSNEIVQQGIVFGQTPFTLTAPSTSGFSQIYLVEAQFQQVDSDPVALYYYNSANPTSPLIGSATNTIRGGVCALQLKAGTAGTSPTAPTADAGWSPLWNIIVTHGQTTIISGNISEASGAPFIPTKVGALGNIAPLNIGAGLENDGSGNLAVIDSSGTGGYVTASFVATWGSIYLVDSAAGAFNITTPPTPAQGNSFRVIDVGKALTTHAVTIVRNTGISTIAGSASSCALNINGGDWLFSVNSTDLRIQ